MSIMTYVYGWVVLVVVVLGIAIRRWMVARRDDEMSHLADTQAALVGQQLLVGRKIRAIDRWGQWLTVIAVLYGFAVLGVYIYGIWVAGAKPPV